MLVKRLGSDDETVIPELLKPYLVVGPNPFNPRTDLRFGLTQEARVKLDILDVRGRRLIRLVDGVTAAGPHVVPWTGVDDRGRTLASGVYFVRLQFGREVLVDKLTLVR